MHGRELWPVEHKEMGRGRNHNQWKEVLRVGHVEVWKLYKF